MNEMNYSPSCERAPDLIAFVYSEANESEMRDFELHLEECPSCRQEVASLGLVRESIIAWRDEALSGFVSTPSAATTRKKSAIAALRQFFDLSPLWLKAATGFAIVTFCLLATLAINRAEGGPGPIKRAEGGSPGSISAKYTQEDVDRLVKQALAQREPPNPGTVTVTRSRKPKKRTATPSGFAKSRRPLTRAEREQLAADLRLLSTDDNGSLNLLGDQINQ